MINKSNDLPSFVNETNLPKIVDKLTDASNIKIANNKYGNRVQTVIDKIVEKADDVTKAIKQEVVNNSYSFKVGTGDVDVSADVEDGFGEVGIKGVTYQNLIIPNSMTKPNNIIIDGDIVTLLDSYNTFEGITYKALTKKNTTYTVVLDVKELFEDGIGYKIQINDGAYLYNEPLKPGINVIKIATKEKGDNYHIAVLKVSTAVGTMKFSKKILLLEGDHTNNPNLPSYFEGIVGVGDKSKNLFNKDNIKQTVLNLGTAGSNCDEVVSQVRCSLRKISCKPNTKYTIKSDKEINAAIGSIGNNNIALGDSNWRNIYNSYTYTTPSDAIELAVNIAKTDNTNIDIDYVKNFNIQIEEGETSTSYEPYYDGHKIEILSNGDNIYDYTKITDNTYINTSGDIVNYTGWFSTDYIRVNKNKKYYFYNQKHRVPFAGLYCYYYDTNKNKIEYLNLGDTEFVGLTEFVSKHDGYIRLSGLSHSIQVGRMYASYDKTQILLDEPLMRLPNGVCDEITRDGILIRRVGKVVFDGSESWKFWYESSNTIGFIYNHNSIMDKNWYSSQMSLVCDRFIPKSGHNFNEDDSEAIAQWNVNNAIFIRINKRALKTLDVNGFKQWLQANPTTVYYELSTPIITELPAPYLRIFKDGHLTFNTLVAPESTHVVQLNKSGQIQNAIKESQSLDNRINVLENNYDNLMLSTMSRLNDLELNYTLK